LAVTAASIVVVIAGIGLWLRAAGQPHAEGRMQLAGLDAPVTVLRDGLGIPYIFAANTPDLLRAQGFVTAQHRLMQMELYRATWRGELAAIFGARALPSDIRIRVLGIRRNGDRHATMLEPASRAYFERYADGINAYIAGHTADHPLELSIAGLAPRPWSVADLVTLIHFIHYSHAANVKAEIVAQQLIDRLGSDRARELFPVPSNPDWSVGATPRQAAVPHTGEPTVDLDWNDVASGSETRHAMGLGSNNWAVAPTRTQSGKAMLANDPHLDNRILPGAWHPVGLFTPEIRAVGAALPGMPGILIGRTQHVAFGVTNAYGDVQDLYIESVDPADANRYLDAGRSVPFDAITETIRVKDGAAAGGYREQALTIRFTRRGPVISDHPGLGPEGQKVVVLRSTDAEVLAPALGIEGLLTAPNAAAFDREVQKIDLMMFNFVFADDEGTIGHRASGAVPIRAGAAAPLIYQELYREIALGTFADELGEPLANDMLSVWYFWQQRFDALVATPDSPWFDDVRTPDRRETLPDVIRAAASRARNRLATTQGVDPASWRWGKAHTLRFVSPLRRDGAGQELLGGFTVERSGSGETLDRGVYDFRAPYAVTFFASMQLVVDLGDPEKIEAVLAGGVNERHFQPHQNDQARLWAAGARQPWWFDRKQIEAHAQSRLILTP